MKTQHETEIFGTGGPILKNFTKGSPASGDEGDDSGSKGKDNGPCLTT